MLLSGKNQASKFFFKVQNDNVFSNLYIVLAKEEIICKSFQRVDKLLKQKVATVKNYKKIQKLKKRK